MPHHVTQRGVRSMPVFHSDIDRQDYLQLLRHHAGEDGIDFWAWCLMDNHVHLVAVPREITSLAAGIGEAHRNYTLRYNEIDAVSGHLFQERFHSFPVQVEGYLFSVVRYVECNPVRAGLVKDASAYPWSSARHHLHGTPDSLVRNSPIRDMFPDWAGVLREHQENLDEIRKHSRTGRPYGSEAWIKSIELLSERPLLPRKRGWKKGHHRQQ